MIRHGHINCGCCRILKKLGPSPVHFIGLSMGGFVGMCMVARHPTMLKSITLMENKVFKTKYRLLTAIVKLFGVKVITIKFCQKYLNDSNCKEKNKSG